MLPRVAGACPALPRNVMAPRFPTGRPPLVKTHACFYKDE
jgi:hypothetical protein